LFGLAVLCLAFGALAVGTPSAFANRTIETKIADLDGPFSVAIDQNDYVWATDRGSQGNPGSNGIYKYERYPSVERLLTPNTYSVWGYYILDLTAAIDDQTGELYIAQSNGRTIDIFEGDGAYTHSWTRINGANTCFNCLPDAHIAIDNSNSPSQGRIYLSLTSPENDIEIFDKGQRPVDFPATANYIRDNKLTGTPSGAFGEVANVAVDNHGNIYVTDIIEGVVDEFDSTGTFIRSFPDTGANQGYPGVGGAGVDPTNGDVLITDSIGGVKEYDQFGNLVETITSDGSGSFQPESAPAVNSDGYAYVPANGVLDIFSPASLVPEVSYAAVGSPTTTSGTLRANVDPNGGGPVTACHFEYGTDTTYGTSVPCSPDPSGSNFTVPTDVSAPISGLTVENTYHYRVVATDAHGTKHGEDQTFTPHHVVGLTTEQASSLTESSATLNGSLVGNGEHTNYFFEWGKTASYGNTTAAPPGSDGGSPSGPDPSPLPASVDELIPYTTYHYRVVASNGSGTSYGADMMFTTLPGAPTAKSPAATVVHADRAILHGQVDPNGADTIAHFEYVDDASFQSSGWADAQTAPEEGIEVGMSKHYQTATTSVNGLQPGTLYHFRIVGDNSAGTGDATTTFRTFAFVPSFVDPCPNAHVRQQTGAALLLDCRAYELASAKNSGGYDVESTLVSGQTPFGGYPQADAPSRLLYGVHDGGIPGTGHPTNHGVDPYVATREENGWTTRYVGIPADSTPSNLPFASTLADANSNLETFAFGGGSICSPCFSDGSTGEPVHLPGGQLVQGMAGSIPQPGAEPAGFIGKALSADGSHFVFGSTSQFEPDGNNNGDVSVYDRNLLNGQTHVVSKTPGGATMTGAGIGELDLSQDGSRVVVGQLLSEAGGRHWHLYMDIGDGSKSVDLTPGTTSGALYGGMTADGSKVFFTTADKLLAQDKDKSADLYEAEVGPSGTATLRLVSTGAGGAGNSDSCDPAANTIREHWNSDGASGNCDVVAVGGGGGVAAADGSVFFLSPELLDGPSNGIADAPNLYQARPGGAPHFVATLESNATAPLPPTEHPFQRSFGSFENGVGAAIDKATGDVYVFDVSLDIGAGTVQKFDSSGHPVTGFGQNGKITVSGVIGFYNIPTSIAVDNDPSSPSYGDLYVPDLQDGIIKKFDSSGALINQIGGLTFPTSVAVDPANGRVYTTSYLNNEVSIFTATGAPVSSFALPAGSTFPTGVAVDSAGTVYVVNGGGQSAAKGSTQIYSSSGTPLGQLGPTGVPSYGVSVDPSDDHVYVDEGNQVVEYDSSGNEVGRPTGVGVLQESISLGAVDGTVVASNTSANDVASFGPPILPPDPSTDDPLVVDSVSEPGERHMGDFAVTPSGDDAVFTSTRPLVGYDSAAHNEVYRYHAPSDALECASCNPTGEQATGDATLPSGGLSITDDGRVFFNSTEGLVDRDLNEKRDPYEWEAQGTKAPTAALRCEEEGGCIQLISPGSSTFDSSLLGVSANGLDAYFFTRDALVPEDENGNRVKIYDARAGGGFAQVPAPIPCKASDECHGAGSQIPPPPNIKTVAGTPVGNQHGPAQRACKAGSVKKKGKCVRKHRRHHHRRHHRGHGNG
jgi:DNA-binding beta-propeller fold protein YncE